MLGLAITSQAARQRAWWPAGARFAADFINRRAMSNGVQLPLSAVLTLSRASVKRAKTSTGHWATFAANEPAITDLGMLIEPEATNLIINNTADSGAGIQLTGTTLTALPFGQSPGLDGFAKRVTQGGGASDSVVRSGLNVSGGTTYTWSQSVRYEAGAPWMRFVFSDNVAHGLHIWLNLATMTIGTTGTFGAAVLSGYSLTAEADGWYRVAMTGSVPNSAVGGLSGYVCGGNSITSRQAGQFHVWLQQMETGLAASSPIESSTSAATRAADSSSFDVGILTTLTLRRLDVADQYISTPPSPLSLTSSERATFVSTTGY
ncbi:hypothetical protein JI749_13855 [Devosia oryziradicis]|uniref:Uncharacterized protein n=1 Tax=Devosia oryziradicis TaxID=2801335 RepID=A0ABX7BU09_9HYPH|nr:hypothetical protein [Devosia oryziradicis]QQR35430.1 hypothetical protein JI749_13855 [Devosia oryziradicis]